MKSKAERCAEYEQFKQIDAAFRAGDLAALRAAVDDPADVPNGPMPLTIGPCLEYAIYHSPLPLIRTLLEIGADPNPVHHIGFPPLIAALACSRTQPGSPGRPDVQEILQLLLACQADPNQRGINDYTALHGGERTESTGRRTPPAGWRGPASPDPRRRLRNAARHGGEAGPARHCRTAQGGRGAAGKGRAAIMHLRRHGYEAEYVAAIVRTHWGSPVHKQSREESPCKRRRDASNAM